ncbi:hypothetical protein [Nostoc sp.]|uniref:hypothetical protein n=1 Tax=Nostoc sp. TaxID=1180 RepID=UPI002FF9FD83
MTNGSPDWVNAIAASRTTLKVEPLFFAGVRCLRRAMTLDDSLPLRYRRRPDS